MTRSQLLCSGVLISAMSLAGFAETVTSVTQDQPYRTPIENPPPAAQPQVVSNSQTTSSNGTTTLNLTIVVPAQQAPQPVTLISTKQFEEGTLHWADVSSPQVELFLRDLNRRRDYDFSQHDEKPGPDHDYLTSWIAESVHQLIGRGYTVDAIGDLHRADHSIVATR